MQVVAFNGKPVKNLKSLANMVENFDDEFLKFDLEYDQVLSLSLSLSLSHTHTHTPHTHTHRGSVCLCVLTFASRLFILVLSGTDIYIYTCTLVQIVVLRTKTAKEATVDILTTHGIPSAISDDLKP
jgi:hypothetical protein